MCIYISFYVYLLNAFNDWIYCQVEVLQGDEDAEWKCMDCTADASVITQQSPNMEEQSQEAQGAVAIQPQQQVVVEDDDEVYLTFSRSGDERDRYL